jgi:Ca2+-transporting ATPase
VTGDPLRGLSESDAVARLKSEGPNELPSGQRRSLLRIVFGVVREPMFGLLLAAGAVYLAVGDLEEGLVLLGFATLSVSIAAVQETRSERVLEALRDLSSPRALVTRDGRQRRIPGREVVRGDVVHLAEGDRVPADARLIEARNLLADESLLTGESVPVRKLASAQAPDSARPGGDDLPFVYSGTLVVAGTGTAIVTATGARSEIGRIGAALGGIEASQPRLTAQTQRLVGVFALIGAAFAAAAVVLYGILRGSWTEALLGGIALGMSMLPEEIPLVLTVFMVMGARRISRANVLTRKAAAIEVLGAATVLCTDKTGTLTLNRMSIVRLKVDGARWDATGEGTPDNRFRNSVETAYLASAPAPFDPMDRACHDLAARSGATGAPGDRQLLHTYPLGPDLLVVANVWSGPGGERLVAAKGAPEAIADVCGLDPAAKARVHADVEAMAREGMRVLGTARAIADAGELPPSVRGFRFAFAGLIGFADPLRPTVPAAIEECRDAGIRVIMITGDHPATARAIASTAGLAGSDVVTGDDLARLSDSELADRVRTTTVFARILPEQKLRIVEALKADGEVVAMTGDGVNDAPSLKAADIGIAMGGRGTDVAREAASIVLLDDDFSSIVTTIRLGRRIYDNIKKAMAYILAVHVPIAGMALLPLATGLPLVLTPMLIALLEMVIDPVCSIVLEAEPEEKNVMRRSPRSPREPLLSPALIGWSLAQGVLALAVAAGVFLFAVREGMPDGDVRSLAFVALVSVNVALIFANRSFSASLMTTVTRRNPVLWLSLIVTGLILALVIAWPPVRDIFQLGRLHADDLALCLAAGLALLVTLEVAKTVVIRRT